MAYFKSTIDVISGFHLALAFFSGIIILASIVFNYICYSEKIEKIFLSILIPIGMLYLVLMVPYYVPDEAPHVIRAYEIYHGEFISNLNDEGNHRAKIPLALKELNLANLNNYQTLNEQMQKQTDYSQKDEVYTEAQGYPGILYMFSGLGMLIGEIFNLNIVLAMYLARIFNYIFFLILAYFSIKKIPFGKMLLSVYLLMPMVLQQAASVSPDSVINSVEIFFISYILYLTFKAEKIQKKEIIFIFGASAFLAVSKVVYLPIVFLLLLINQNKKITKKQKLIIIIGSITIAIILGASWYLFQTRYHDERQYVLERNINSTEQIKNILSQPLQYLKTLGNTLEKMGTTYTLDMVGLNLGWQDIQTPIATTILALFLIIISGWFEKHEVSLNKKQKIWTLLIVIGTILLVFTALYIAWTEVGAGIVVGVQGRYFIPVAILIFLCLCMRENHVKIKNIKEIYYILFCIINFCAINSVIEFFINK